MWQRIQTVWLVLVGALMGILLGVPVLAFVDAASGEAVQQMTAWAIEDMRGTQVGVSWPVGVLASLVGAMALVSILMYRGSRGRTFQVRLGVLSSLILLGLLGYIGFAAYQHCATSGLTFGVKFALALPLVALVLEYLAIRAILKDEMLVRMSNRLR